MVSWGWFWTARSSGLRPSVSFQARCGPPLPSQNSAVTCWTDLGHMLPAPRTRHLIGSAGVWLILGVGGGGKAKLGYNRHKRVGMWGSPSKVGLLWAMVDREGSDF